MNQTSTIANPPFSSDRERQILCFYVNDTNTLQVLNILNTPQFIFDRLVFPGERLMFEAVPEAILKVTSETSNQETSISIPCLKLQVK